MDVLLVTAVVGGGVGRHVQHLARGLSERGHRVVVACPVAVEEQFRFTEHGARVVPVEIGSGRLPVLSRRLVLDLRGLMAKVDVTHAHGVRAGAYAALGRGGEPEGPPLVVTTHNAPPSGVSGLVYAVLEQIIARRADVVLGVSPDLVDRARSGRSHLGRAGSGRSHSRLTGSGRWRLGRAGSGGARAVGLAVVPAGDITVLTEEARYAARQALRTELGLPLEGGPPVIFSAGRLAPQKRTALLVDAYHRLVTAGPGHGPVDTPVLVIAGDGPEREQLERLVAAGPGDVRLLGHRADVPTLLAGSDVAVSAAVWEGQPLFIQEALAAGLPIVATDVGGTGVVLGGAGILVRGEDEGGDGAVAEELAGALARVLDDPQHAADLRARSLARAADLPSLDDAVEAALTVYRQALARS